MNVQFCLMALSLGFFMTLLAIIQMGWRYGRKFAPSSNFMESLRGTEAAIFGMLGLLIAFTFYGAASRFDARRQLVVEESNTMGTAYLRLDLLHEPARKEAQRVLKAYVDKRLEVYADWLKPLERLRDVQASQEIQNQLWTIATTESQKETNPHVGILLLPVLNQMFDIANTRMSYLKIHPPKVIYVLLAGIALLCGAIAGYSMAKDSVLNWLHVIGFSLTMAFTFYVILDIEYPRAGFIRINDTDLVIQAVRQSMN